MRTTIREIKTMGALNNAMYWLGLSKDAEAEYYEDDDFAPQRGAEVDRPALSAVPYEEREASMTPVRQQRSQMVPHAPAVHDDAMQRIVTIHPRSYNDAKSIGDSFRSGIPVIVNLSEMQGDDKRLIDFCAGLAYGLEGHISPVTSKVYLLSPAAYSVDEESASEGSSFYNQS